MSCWQIVRPHFHHEGSQDRGASYRVWKSCGGQQFESVGCFWVLNGFDKSLVIDPNSFPPQGGPGTYLRLTTLLWRGQRCQHHTEAILHLESLSRPASQASDSEGSLAAFSGVGVGTSVSQRTALPMASEKHPTKARISL